MLAEVVRVPEEVGHSVPQRVHEAEGEAGSEDAVPRPHPRQGEARPADLLEQPRHQTHDDPRREQARAQLGRHEGRQRHERRKNQDREDQQGRVPATRAPPRQPPPQSAQALTAVEGVGQAEAPATQGPEIMINPGSHSSLGSTLPPRR